MYLPGHNTNEDGQSKADEGDGQLDVGDGEVLGDKRGAQDPDPERGHGEGGHAGEECHGDRDTESLLSCHV